jgi:predicted PurR-regulated permease PerM
MPHVRPHHEHVHVTADGRSSISERDDAPRLSASSLPSISPADRARLRVLILLVLATVSVWAVGTLLSPFLLGIVMASVFAVLAHPIHETLRRRTGPSWVSAIILTVVIFLGVMIPLLVVVMLLVDGIQSGISTVSDRVQDFASQRGEAWNWLASTASVFGVSESELSSAMRDQLGRVGDVVAGGTVGLLTGIGGWIVQGAIGLFTLFYLLRDGEMFTSVVRWLIPLDQRLTDALIAKTTEVISATVLGTLVVAAVQGTLGGLLFWVLGLPGPALWGTVMAFLSILPAVGPPVVWAPAAVILVSADQLVKAAILVAVGLLVIATVDNVLRAVLVGQRARLHPLVVFFSVLGGLVVFGAAGILLGPVVVVVAFSALEIGRVALDASAAPDHSEERKAVLAGVTVEDDPDRPAEEPK